MTPARAQLIRDTDEPDHAKRYRHRAEECRTLADQTVDANQRRQLLVCADDYERWAAFIEGAQNTRQQIRMLRGA